VQRLIIEAFGFRQVYTDGRQFFTRVVVGAVSSSLAMTTSIVIDP
jgi:hypothetical protein